MLKEKILTRSPINFIGDIKDCVVAGEGFVPFIGSGCSAASGILTGMEFQTLLFRTCQLCLTEPEHGGPLWDLRRHGWPPVPTQRDADAAKKWAQDHLREAMAASKWATESPEGCADELAHQAARVLFLEDWRATLYFLSKLKYDPDSNAPSIAEPSPAVIDSFNAHITRGRKPNLTHTMLCHLAGPARFRTILTTNFDNLIEDAFNEARDPIEVISVSIHGALPAPELVRARNTIVKLHGTLFETRADFSLDEAPPQQDLDYFFQYVRGGPASGPEPVEGCFLPAHLLVCGYSGSDPRCMAMLRGLLEKAIAPIKIFWICFDDRDRDRVTAFFEKIKPGHEDSVIITTRSTRPDLLLYELYQHLCLSLPRGGLTYHYTANAAPGVDKVSLNKDGIPHAGESGAVENRDEDASLKKEFLALEKWVSDKRPRYLRRPAVVTGGSGVLAILRSFVEKPGRPSVWMELEDYADTFCLAYDLFQILARRRGLFPRTHADLLPPTLTNECDRLKKKELIGRWKAHIYELNDRHLRLRADDWTIVLYGRNGPGNCSGWDENRSWDDGKSFPDPDRPKDSERLYGFVHGLTAVGFRVIYAPYNQERMAEDEQYSKDVREVFKNGAQAAEWPTLMPHDDEGWAGYRHIPLNAAGTSPIDFKQNLKVLEKWIKKGGDIRKGGQKNPRPQFLYACSLFRQSRHYSAFLCEAVLPCPRRFNHDGIDNDWMRNEDAEKLRGGLVKKIFFEKPGGFAWTYRTFRLGMRTAAELSVSHGAENPSHFRSYYHFWIADWYMRAFYTTGHAAPLLEALFHFYQTIKHVRHYRGGHHPRGKMEKQNLVNVRYRYWRMAICGMTTALRLGHESLSFWLGEPELKGWFLDSEIKKVNETCRVTRDPKTQTFPKNPPFELEEVELELQGAALEDHCLSLETALQVQLEQCLKWSQTHAGDHLDGKPASRVRSYLQHVAPPALRDPADDSAEKALETTSGGPSIPEHPIERLSDLAQSLCRNLEDSSSGAHANLKTNQWEQIRKLASDADLYDAMQTLNENAFFLTCHAKLQFLIASHEQSAKGGPIPLVNPQVLQYWQAITVLCNTSLICGRLLHPAIDHAGYPERVKSLCIYGLGLAHLGRFYEAHRRFNEANALLSKLGTPHNDILLGILELRRAEAHLVEAILLRNLATTATAEKWKPFDREKIMDRYRITGPEGKKLPIDLGQLRVAKLDDAWCTLETAERLLAGRLHSTRWWSRFCALKLWCLAETPFSHHRSLTRRLPSSRAGQIVELFDAGLVSCFDHSFLRLQIADFAVQAMNNLKKEQPGQKEKRPPELEELPDEFKDSILNVCGEARGKILPAYAAQIKTLAR